MQHRNLEHKYAALESIFKSKDEESRILGERLSIEKKKILEIDIKYSGFEQEKNALRRKIKEEQLNSALKDEKLAKKKIKIDVMKEALAKVILNSPTYNILKKIIFIYMKNKIIYPKFV